MNIFLNNKKAQCIYKKMWKRIFWENAKNIAKTAEKKQTKKCDGKILKNLKIAIKSPQKIK